MSDKQSCAVDLETRANAHKVLDAWLDRCGEQPVQWKDSESHELKFEAAIDGWCNDNDEDALWTIIVERREREQL